MNHRNAWPLLEGFLDGELRPEVRWGVAAHVADCPTCRAYLADQARLRALVRDRLGRTTASADLAPRLRAALAADPAPSPLVPWRRRPPRLLVAFVTLLLVPTLLAFWLLWRPAPESGPPFDLAAELVAPHTLFARDETLLEVAGDPTTVAAWFGSNVAFPVAVPELPGYEFDGGRLVTIDGRPAAQLVYEDEPAQAYVSLFHFQVPREDLAGLGAAGRFAVGRQEGFAVVVWSEARSDAALVALLPEAELVRLATAIGRSP